MKTEELMVGNYLLDPNNNVCCVFRIEGDTGFISVAHIFSGFEKYSYSVCSYKSIFLTHELLLKCGFVVDLTKGGVVGSIPEFYTRTVTNLNGITYKETIMSNFKTGVYSDSNGFTFQYLHEFQNYHFCKYHESLQVNLWQ